MLIHVNDYKIVDGSTEKNLINVEVLYAVGLNKSWVLLTRKCLFIGSLTKIKSNLSDLFEQNR